MKTTYISIDWGGTHLKGAIIKENIIKKEFNLPAGNLKIIFDEELLNICKQIIDLIKNYNESNIIMLIGAAGVSNDITSNRLIKIINSLTNSFEKIIVYPDYLCNHVALLNGNDGIISINGTGSILFGVNEAKMIRQGGWGYVFDETPSGGYFGKKYLEAVLIGLDGDYKYSYYVNDFKLNNGFVNREEILNQVYFASSIQQYLGNYAINFINAYNKKDNYAIKTINDSVELLSKSILDLTIKLNLSNPKFCGSGGLWDNWIDFKPLVDNSCKNRGIKLDWQEKTNPLTLGPFLCYKYQHCFIQQINT